MFISYLSLAKSTELEVDHSDLTRVNMTWAGLSDNFLIKPGLIIMECPSITIWDL